MQIEVPFMADWKEKMLNDEKLCTSRSKVYGLPGDTFPAFGAAFELIHVTRMELGDVALFLHRLEGCQNPLEFQRIWMKLHPHTAWDPHQDVYPHFFLRVGSPIWIERAKNSHVVSTT